MVRKRNDDSGGKYELILVLGLFGMVFLFALGMFLIDRFTTKPQEELTWPDSSMLKMFEPVPIETHTVIEEIRKAGVQTQNLFQKLEEEVRNYEKILEEKKKALADIEKEIGMLELTPEQLNTIKERKKYLKEKLTLIEWFTKATVWYGILTNFLIAWTFYILGKRRERKKIKKER